MTRTESPDITEREVIDFLSNYENEGLGISALHINSGIHLLSERTDLSMWASLLLAQMSGLQPAFIDIRRFNSIRFEVFIERYHGDFAALMLPGYTDIFEGTYICDEHHDRPISYRLIRGIMKHFNREREFASRGVVPTTITDIVAFINQPVLVKVAPLPEINKLFIRLITFTSIFGTYWLLTDLKAAAISTVVAFIFWAAYKSFKQFMRDVRR